MKTPFTLLLLSLLAAPAARAEKAAGYLEVSAVSYENQTWMRENSGDQAGTQFAESPHDKNHQLKTGGNLGLGVYYSDYLAEMSTNAVSLFKSLSPTLDVGAHLHVDQVDAVDYVDRERRHTDTKTTDYNFGPTVLGRLPLDRSFAVEWRAQLLMIGYRQERTETKTAGTAPEKLTNASQGNWSVGGAAHLESILTERLSLLSGVGYDVRHAKYAIDVETGGKTNTKYSYDSQSVRELILIDIAVVRVKF